jgi:hypothetical protein
MLYYAFALASFLVAPLVASKTASFTYYESYPRCCCGQKGWPTSPNCDPNAPKDECEDYSGCEYMGDFAAFMTDSNEDGHKSIDYVKSHNLVSFFDASDPNGKYFDSRWAKKTIEITKVYNNKTYKFNATIADTCRDADCMDDDTNDGVGCCTANAKPYGFLVDMEYYTVLNNFGTLNAADGSLSYVIY